MKRALSLVLALLICVGCGGCGGSSTEKESNREEIAAELPENIQSYVPGTTIETDFGSVTVMDAAFTAKAQIYYTKSSRSSKTTINGQTTESYDETIHPGYISTMENKMVFALKTVMTNTTSEDIEIQKLSVKATFVENSPVYFSKGGNFHISDEAYKILPAGGSSEIILAALLPVDQYLLTTECLLEIGGAELGFSYDNINVYNVLGFQEGDNTPVAIDEVIQIAANSAVPHVAATEAETEPQETEPEIETRPGTYQKTGASIAEGRAITIKNVSIGFMDQLPNHILNDRNTSHYIEELTLNKTQVYSVISFTATNLTTETIDLADIHDDFLVQLTYNNGYQYSTNTDVYAIFESGANIKRVRRNSTGGNAISISPLASADVTVYIPCARQVAEGLDKPLIVTFIAKYSGNESLVFEFSNEQNTVESINDLAAADATVAPTGDIKTHNFDTDGNITVHSITSQDLGDGKVRFTVDCTAQKGRMVSFFDPPDGDKFKLINENGTTGSRESLVFEIEESDMKSVSCITLKFFNWNSNDYECIFINGPL